MVSKTFNVIILISGNGSNLQAIIDQKNAGILPIEICAVVSNRLDAYGLIRAKNAGIPTIVINHRDYSDRQSFDEAMRQKIDKFNPNLIVLAGFMRILSDEFVNHYLGRMINIHPSLLPDYRGLDTHQRVLNDGKDIHGVSVHYVTPELDGGPVFMQSTVPVEAHDTVETLAQKVHTEEHIIYPLAIKLIAEKRIVFNEGSILLDGTPLLSPIISPVQ